MEPPRPVGSLLRFFADQSLDLEADVVHAQPPPIFILVSLHDRQGPQQRLALHFLALVTGHDTGQRGTLGWMRVNLSRPCSTGVKLNIACRRGPKSR